MLQEMGITSRRIYFYLQDKNIWCMLLSQDFTDPCGSGQVFLKTGQSEFKFRPIPISRIGSEYLFVFQSGDSVYGQKHLAIFIAPIAISSISSTAMPRTSGPLSIRKTTFGFIPICHWVHGVIIQGKKNGSRWDQKRVISPFFCQVT